MVVRTNVMRAKSSSIPKGSSVATSDYKIVQAKLKHGRGIYETICLANDFDPSEHIGGVFGLEDWSQTLNRFPAGQFVAVARVKGQEKVIGVAIAMCTSYAPSAKPLSWREMIGDLTLAHNDPKGRWLYGVEKAVHPEYQGKGIGSALYKAQFKLVKDLRLRGMFAGGMLKGYRHFKGRMSIREYAGKVMRGEIFDPTVSVQMRKGFKPRTLIENYSWDHEAEHTGMLIVYEPSRPVLSEMRNVSRQAL